MKHIKNKLQKIEKDRSIQRKHRHKTGFYLVSLAGYTNAGKSSLLNCLTNNEIAVRNQLFSTLSTTTRKIQTDKIPILLTDTVGFIQDLPAWIINAFHSTLEEIKKADVVILVADVSDPVDLLLKKIQTSLDELQYLEVVSPVILVLNKSDLIPSDKQDEIERRIDASSQFTSIHHLFLSVKTGNGVQTLLGDLIDLLPNLVHITLQLPQSEEVLPFISWLYEKTYVLSVSYKKNIVISLKCSQQIMKIIDDFCKKHNGNIF